MTGDTPTGRRVLGIGSMVVVMVAAVLVIGPIVTGGESHPDHPPATSQFKGDDPAERPAMNLEPIRGEADVFRTKMTDLAVDPHTTVTPGTRVRTLAQFRALRAYPGAPPRIPHELNEVEFRETQCLTCHERGGFSPRFDAYTPVTPHPEKTSCLQCHVPDSGTGLFKGSDWVTPTWPELPSAALPGGPPPMPHDLQLRENCMTCHTGPGAVAEIRTPHADRPNCRQCHVPAVTEEEVFVRPGAVPGAASPPNAENPGGGR